MRLSRLRYIEIEELRSWINLLIEERDFNSQTQSNAVAKMNSGEYVEHDFELFATTLDELKQTVRTAEEDNELISNLIRSKKLELRVKFQARDREVKHLKDEAIILTYKLNKAESKRIAINMELLDRIISKIKYGINRDKDTLEFAVIFHDGSMHKKSIKLDAIQELIVKEG